MQEETEADGAPETAPDGEMQAEPGADGVPETAPDREADVMPGADGAPGAEPGADGALAELQKRHRIWKKGQCLNYRKFN